MRPEGVLGFCRGCDEAVTGHDAATTADRLNRNTPLGLGRSAMLRVPPHEYTIQAVRSQGAGGQNVNKVATAAHLRFDVRASSLPPEVKQRLLERSDRRLSAAGVLTIKAQRFRTQEQNRTDAVARLHALIEAAAVSPVKRRATKPSRAARERRLAGKHRRAQIKSLRRQTDE